MYFYLVRNIFLALKFFLRIYYQYNIGAPRSRKRHNRILVDVLCTLCILEFVYEITSNSNPSCNVGNILLSFLLAIFLTSGDCVPVLFYACLFCLRFYSQPFWLIKLVIPKIETQPNYVYG